MKHIKKFPLNDKQQKLSKDMKKQDLVKPKKDKALSSDDSLSNIKVSKRYNKPSNKKLSSEKHLSKGKILKINEFFYLKNSDLGESLKKKFDKPTEPEEPIKRKLTREEARKMHKHYPLHSYSGIDNKGRIVLGGGEESRGLYYITEEDLAKLN